MFLLSDLSPGQRRVMEHPLDHDLYIEAPAGYGKTTAAMLKAAYSAESLANSPHQQVLVLTFSKMAVRQIDYEKRQQVPNSLHSKILIKTYHAFYFDLIRRYARYLGFDHSDFGLLTTEERKALHLLFSVSHPGLRYPSFSCAQYLSTGVCPPMPVEDAQPMQLARSAACFLEDYHREEHRLGFEDFPYYAYRVLASSAFICGLLAYKYPVIFLDEFQNTTNLEWSILKCFIANVKLVVLADPHQTIHVFRGAGRAIRAFRNERKPHLISLEKNFRNSRPLHAFAQGIATGKFDAPKPSNVTFHALRLYRRDKYGLKFDILRSFSPLVRSIAVLTKENQHVAELSKFLGKRTQRTPAIAHEVVTDDLAAQDEENVVLALFQLITTGDLRHLAKLASALCACATSKANYMFYLGQASRVGRCTPEAVNRMSNVPGSQNARTVLRLLKLPLEGGVAQSPEEAWERTKDVVQKFIGIRTLPNFHAAFKRVRQQWDMLDAREGTPSVEAYMPYVLAQRRRRNFLEQRSYLRGVFVMTLHQSQGKQFDSVFIWRCNDEIIRHPEEVRKGHTGPSQHLLYVGITRAKHFVRIYYEESERRQPSRLIRPFLP